MPARIHARYANGVLTPLDPLDLREGVELALAIDTAQPVLPAPAEADPRISQPDFSRNKKRYLYGHPKQEDCCERSLRTLRGG